MHDSRRGDGHHDPLSDPDAVARAIAARQHGVISRSQLLEAGVNRGIIEHRLRTGRLGRVHRGVYRLGPVQGRHARETAALLACGEGAVLSHGTAAVLWGLVPERALVPIHVTGPRSLRGPRQGVRLHRVGRLYPDEVAHRDGLRLTTPARTLLDLAAGVRPGTLEGLLARAERTETIRRGDLQALLDRHPGRKGVRTLRGLLHLPGGPALTRSRAEARFLALIRKGDLPRPLVNTRIEGLEVDFLWRDGGLVAEIDGFAYHAGRGPFERDRRRDAILAAAGLRVVRITWRQLTEQPEVVLVQLAQALARGRPVGAGGE